MIRKNCPTWLFLLAVCQLLLTACGGGGGEERAITGIPLPPAATTLTAAAPQQGSLTTADAELFYKIAGATTGTIYSLEIFAARRNQAAWDAANNIPLLRIYRPGTTAGTMDLYLEHDYTGSTGTFPWLWGKHDLDIPRFRIPANGDYYISVSNDATTRPGSNYILRLSSVAIPGLINDAATDNSTSAAALAIAAGDTVYDHHTDGGSNFYTFSIATPTLACFEINAYRNGRFMGDVDYFDPTLVLRDGSNAATATILADGNTDLDLDDYLFSDPRLCYKLTTAGSYWLEAKNFFGSGSSDYFLSFTADEHSVVPFIGETEGLGGTSNNATGTAEAIAYGNTIIAHVGNGSDTQDYFSFNATPGDLMQLRIFDASNSQDATAGVFVELFTPGGAKVLPASAPATDTVTPTKYYVTGPGAFTVRALLHADASAGTTAGNYLLRFTPRGAGTLYTFSLENLRAASFAVNDETVEQDNAANNTLGALTSEDLDLSNFAAGNLDSVADVDTWQFAALQGALVTVNVYAKAPTPPAGSTTTKAHDLDGFGSTMEPRLEIYRQTDTVTPLYTARYRPLANNVTAESIAVPRPTLSVSFIAPDPDIAPGGATYYLRIFSDSFLNATTDTYFIEVIK